MDFGVFLDFSRRKGSTQAQIFQEAFDLVDMAEENGLDTIWLGESHFNPNRSVMSAPIVVASSIATRTEHLRVGMAGPATTLSYTAAGTDLRMSTSQTWIEPP